jgi:hypothetical protein
MVGNTSFIFRLVGTSGCEILVDGKVVAWTVDEPWAAVIVRLLDGADEGHASASLTAGETRPSETRYT